MKKRVLFISSRPIYPIMSGGQIRTAQQLEFLVQRYSVDVLFFTEEKSNAVIRDYLPDVNREYSFYFSKLECYMQTLRFLFNDLPLQVNYYYNRKVQSFVTEHLYEYDIVFCNNIRTSEYVGKSEGIIKVLDFVDAISMNYEKAKKQAHGIKKIIYEIDYKRCMKYEQQVLRKFDSCAIISDIDKKYIMKCQEKYMLSEIR